MPADGPICAVYLFTSTGRKVGQRKGEIGPEEFLLDREGFVVADAGSVFDASFAREDLIESAVSLDIGRFSDDATVEGDGFGHRGGGGDDRCSSSGDGVQRGE